jgi:mRNA-degrading endonuclease RelE of RelBE toxin-antitoxin system
LVIRAVRWHPEALATIRDLKRRNREDARRIGRAIDAFARLGKGDVKRLAGRVGEYRLRSGDWRVRFVLDASARAMIITDVARRSEASYRD